MNILVRHEWNRVTVVVTATRDAALEQADYYVRQGHTLLIATAVGEMVQIILER